MRKIKFRAFTSVDKTMHRSIDIKELMKVGRVSEDCIIMQFTGLLDKNGKEIYEGDILEIEHVGVYGKPHFTVKWSDKNLRWCLIRPTSGAWEYPGLWENPLKVIGNIYQNSELLKD